jgi:hypothetical protein
MCEWSTPNDHVTSQIEHGAIIVRLMQRFGQTGNVQVDIAKRRRERTGSYPDERDNGRSVHWCTSW